MKYAEEKNYTIYNASCLDVMDSMEANSIDCIVTDPPYEIGFMNKGWDNTGIAFSINTWKKALRVLKPGGYLLAFNHSRTFHRMMVAIEDAGFELRDTIMYLYGSGFPKSHNIGKSVDEKLGNSRKIIGIDKNSERFKKYKEQDGNKRKTFNDKITKGNSKWEGYGTALKPAFEPIVVARKPFNTSVAENVLRYGVGGLNIDECRIGSETMEYQPPSKSNVLNMSIKGQELNPNHTRPDTIGRFPANIIHDGSEEAVSGFPDSNGSSAPRKNKVDNNVYGKYNQITTQNDLWGDTGSASRYFYTAKASVKDRDEGLDEFIHTTVDDGRDKSIDNAYQRGETLRKNIHPTVKPTDLMQYLIRLVAPKGAKVMDIFMGSGSTGKACMIENTERDADYHFIGIDLEQEYCEIAQARIEWGINFRELEDTHILYDDDGNEKKVIQDSFDLWGDED